MLRLLKRKRRKRRKKSKVNKMELNLPTVEECEQIWDEYHVPPNVREHMKAVARVAVFLAKKLKEKGIHVDVGLAERAALLHDLLRSANFEDFGMQKDASMEDIEFWKQMKHKYGNIHHGESAADILADKYPEVAEVIKGHITENIKDSLPAASWELKILVYADSRVVHDRIVSMAERDRDIDKRHGKFYDELKKSTGIDYKKKTRETLRNVEKEIFEKLDITPEDVNEID
jgi:uncharacterized protein